MHGWSCGRMMSSTGPVKGAGEPTRPDPTHRPCQALKAGYGGHTVSFTSLALRAPGLLRILHHGMCPHALVVCNLFLDLLLAFVNCSLMCFFCVWGVTRWTFRRRRSPSARRRTARSTPFTRWRSTRRARTACTLRVLYYFLLLTTFSSRISTVVLRLFCSWHSIV